MGVRLTVEHDYLIMTTEEWLDDVSTLDETLTAEFQQWTQNLYESEGYSAQYVTDGMVRRWLRQRFGGRPTGIYGEDDGLSISTCNMESLLSGDISFVFAHRAGDGVPLIIVHGLGYSLSTAGSAHLEVREFIGDDDADAVSFSSGYAWHVTSRGDNCQTEWILDTPNSLWRNGGSGSVHVSDCIKETRAGYRHVYCPDCGGRMVVSTY